MTDIVHAASVAIAMKNPWAPAFAALTGCISSAGPCLAPRLLAITSLSGMAQGRNGAITAAFVGGIVLVYAAFGAFGSFVWQIAKLSTIVYMFLALAFATIAANTLARGFQCAHVNETPASNRIGAAFTAGSSMALLVSPCCTPLLLAAIWYGSSSGSALYAAVILAAFALGHCVPVVTSSVILGRIRTKLTISRDITEGANVVGCGLMFALAGYYALLA